MPLKLRLDHVQIAAPPGCEAEARAFFGGVLGLEEIPKEGGTRSSGGAWFRTANLELHVGVEEDFRPARKAHVALSVDDLASLHSVAERLLRAGYHARFDKRLPSVTRFFTDDPWGNRLEFLFRDDLGPRTSSLCLTEQCGHVPST